MALIHCPECNQKISDKATLCPHCGYPLQQIKNNEKNYNTSKKTLRERFVANLKKHFYAYIFCFCFLYLFIFNVCKFDYFYCPTPIIIFYLLYYYVIFKDKKDPSWITTKLTFPMFFMSFFTFLVLPYAGTIPTPETISLLILSGILTSLFLCHKELCK